MKIDQIRMEVEQKKRLFEQSKLMYEKERERDVASKKAWDTKLIWFIMIGWGLAIGLLCV